MLSGVVVVEVVVVLVELELVEVLAVVSGVVLVVYLLIQTSEERLITELGVNNQQSMGLTVSTVVNDDAVIVPGVVVSSANIFEMMMKKGYC